MKQCIMTPTKKHSTLPSSQPEVYNKDLEALVEVLQDKLEGVELREEHLKERVKELQKTIYMVYVITQNTSDHTNTQPHTIAFFNTLEEADKYLQEEIKSVKTNTSGDFFFLRNAYSIRDIPQSAKINRWRIDGIAIGSPVNRDCVIVHHKAYHRDGELSI